MKMAWRMAMKKKIKIRENSIDIEHRQRSTNIHIIRMSEEENRQ